VSVAGTERNTRAYTMQIPRLYNVYREQGLIDNFQQMLDNIFLPLFEVSRDPASHPQLHIFLTQARGVRFDQRRNSLAACACVCVCVLCSAVYVGFCLWRQYD
jgi:hypothetical protein